jgi:hypothetical protein
MEILDKLKGLEGDAKASAYRLAGRQFVKMTREPLVTFLAKNLGPDDPSMRGRIASFLDTELGEAIVSAMLSMGLSMMPKTAGDVPSALAQELRIKAMTDVGDVLADLLMGPLREIICLFLQGEKKEVEALPQESESVVRFPSPQEVPQEVSSPVKVSAK